MRLALLAVGVMLIVAVGVYIGLSGFQQYAVESSRSRAGQVLCAPDRPVTAPGRAVAFSVSGLPDGTAPYWSLFDGRSESASDNRLSVIYDQRGEKTVFAFFFVGNLWQRISCSVTVR